MTPWFRVGHGVEDVIPPPSLPTSDPDYKQQPAKVYLKINRLNDTFISHLLRRPWWQRSPHRALETLDHRGRWLTHCLHTTEGQHWGWGLPLCPSHTGRGLDLQFKTVLHHAADHSLFYLMYPISRPHPSYSNIDEHGHICCSKILFKSFFNTWVVVFKSQSGPFTKLSVHYSVKMKIRRFVCYFNFYFHFRNDFHAL